MVIETKNRKIANLTAKYNQMKRKLEGCGTVLVEHERRMLQYKAKLTLVRERSRDSNIAHVQINENDDKIHKLTSHDLSVLSAYPLLKKSDRKFVATILKMMYRGNEHELQHRKLRITKKCGAQAKVITPEKLVKIYSLMAERVAKSHDSTDIGDRVQVNYIKSLISKELYNVRNS